MFTYDNETLLFRRNLKSGTHCARYVLLPPTSLVVLSQPANSTNSAARFRTVIVGSRINTFVWIHRYQTVGNKDRLMAALPAPGAESWQCWRGSGRRELRNNLPTDLLAESVAGGNMPQTPTGRERFKTHAECDLLVWPCRFRHWYICRIWYRYFILVASLQRRLGKVWQICTQTEINLSDIANRNMWISERRALNFFVFGLDNMDFLNIQFCFSLSSELFQVVFDWTFTLDRKLK